MGCMSDDVCPAQPQVDRGGADGVPLFNERVSGARSDLADAG